MLSTVIRFILRFRVVAILLVLGLSILSIYAIFRAPLDAIPDISDPQVVVYVKWPRSAQLIESQVTEPLIRALVGSPHIQSIRGTSHMGHSPTYVTLDSSAPPAKVQQRLLDRTSPTRPQSPPHATVSL